MVFWPPVLPNRRRFAPKLNPLVSEIDSSVDGPDRAVEPDQRDPILRSMPADDNCCWIVDVNISDVGGLQFLQKRWRQSWLQAGFKEEFIPTVVGTLMYAAGLGVIAAQK